ncbi:MULTISPECIES: hypothetical protein [unclassified Tolypothrix]|nr:MULTISPECIES: hypothetical protein [unclassified Tolypothrix]UYD36474.1 hypothetical protein HG267_12435 [Tolypothrix sp. PCC 7601]
MWKSNVIALQNILKIKRSPAVEVRSPCRIPQKSSDRLLWKCDRFI